MQTERMDQSLEALNKRFEKLVLHRPESNISEEHRRRIADKFATKSLQELNEMAGQLDAPKIPYNK